MKMRKQLITVLLFLALWISACGGKTEAAVQNPYYEELNCVTYSEFNSPLGNVPQRIGESYEFHLGDTISQIGKNYDELRLETASLAGQGSRSVLTVEKTTGSEEASTILWAAVDGEAGIQDLPVTGYEVNSETSPGAIKLPSAIADLINTHKEEERWSGYDSENLCFVSIRSEELAPGYYIVNASVTVFADSSYNQYLQYKIECLCSTLTDGQLAEIKELMKDHLDELTDEQRADMEGKERLLVQYMTLKNVTLKTPHQEKSRDYADQVMDFVESGRNRQYFLTQGDVTYTILEPYGDLCRKQEWNQNAVVSSGPDTLGAYNSSSVSDTAWNCVSLKSAGSGFMTFSAATNFGGESMDAEGGLVAQVRHYGQEYGAGSVALPENVEDALVQHWMGWISEGAGSSTYQYDHETITVCSTGLSPDSRICEFLATVTPREYPDITICYEAVVGARQEGWVLDANFGLKEYY